MKQIETHLIVKDPLHHSQLGHNLWQLYQGRLLFDVSILSSDGIKLRAHWVVLCGASEIFRSMMDIDVKSQAVLIDIPSNILGLILKYLYTGEIKVTSVNYLKLIEVAKAQKLYRLAELIEQQFVSILKKHPDIDLVTKIEPADIDESIQPSVRQDSSAHHEETSLPECQGITIKTEPEEPEEETSLPECQGITMKTEPEEPEEETTKGNTVTAVNKSLVLREVKADKLKSLQAEIKAGTIQPIIVKKEDTELRRVLTRPNSDMKTLKTGLAFGTIQPVVVKRPQSDVTVMRMPSKPNILRRNTSSNNNSCSVASLSTGTEKQVYMPAHIGSMEKQASIPGQIPWLYDAGSQVKESLPTKPRSTGKLTSLLFKCASKDEQVSAGTYTASKALSYLLVKTADKDEQILKQIEVKCTEKTGPLFGKTNSEETKSSSVQDIRCKRKDMLPTRAGSEQTGLSENEPCSTSTPVVEMSLQSSGVVLTKTTHTIVKEKADKQMNEANNGSMKKEMNEANYESMIEIDHALDDSVPVIVNSVSLKEQFLLPPEKVSDERLKYFYKRPVMKTALQLVRYNRKKFYPKLIKKEDQKNKKRLWCGTCKKQFKSKTKYKEHTESVSCKLRKKHHGAGLLTNSKSGERRRVYRPRKIATRYQCPTDQSKSELESCPTDSHKVERKERKRGGSRKTDHFRSLSDEETSVLGESKDEECVSNSQDSVEKKKRERSRKSDNLDCYVDLQDIVDTNVGEAGELADSEDKELVSDSLDSVVTKKRGRPRKTDNLGCHSERETSELKENEDVECLSDSQDGVSKKRKRGRPRKIDNLDCTDDLQNIVARPKSKRGRPRKTDNLGCHSERETSELKENEDVECLSNSQDGVSKKRKRGRPRKIDNLDCTDDLQNIVARPKSKRGRPRKTDNSNCSFDSQNIVVNKDSETSVEAVSMSEPGNIVEKRNIEFGIETDNLDSSSASQDSEESETGNQTDDLDWTCDSQKRRKIVQQKLRKIVQQKCRKKDKTKEGDSTDPPTDLRWFEFIHCPECEEMFTLADLLREHLANLHSYTNEQVEKHMSNRFKCGKEDCGYRGGNTKHLQKHMATTHPDVYHDCPHCYRHFRLKDNLQQHIKLTHDPAMQEKYLFLCDVCQIGFMSVLEKDGHEKVEHGVDHPIEVYECSLDGCEMRTWSEKQLYKHKLAHHTATFPFACSRCGKPYRSKHGLRNHVQKMHKGVRKMFLCQVCGMSFTTKCGMAIHSRTQHTRVDRLDCEHCTTFQTFSRRNLANHMYHKHRIKASFDPRPILHCKECNYSSINPHRMKRHMSSAHSDVRSFSCKLCTKSFKSNWELTLHKQVHSVVRSHACPECDFSSKFRGTLDKHIKLQHWFQDYRPYLCTYCQFGSNMMVKVRNHVRQVHPGQEVIVKTDNEVKEQMKIIMLEKKKEGNSE